LRTSTYCTSTDGGHFKLADSADSNRGNDHPVDIQGGEIVNNPIMRFAKSTTATQSGFIAAGLTVTILAVVTVILNWI
jgi:hypothetical protein